MLLKPAMESLPELNGHTQPYLQAALLQSEAGTLATHSTVSQLRHCEASSSKGTSVGTLQSLQVLRPKTVTTRFHSQLFFADQKAPLFAAFQTAATASY